MKPGYKKFINRYNSKKNKKFLKCLKKRNYLEYEYECLPEYFTKRTDFYYNLDTGLASLLSDLLINYKLLSNDFIDMSEYGLGRKLKFVIKFFKRYSRIDKLDLIKNPRQKQKYERDKKKAFDYFRDIFGLLWY